jgi:sensor histidine kinase regulating citrate/malate metabolism
MIKGTIILTNRVPIMEGNSVVGAIATFRDKTRVIHLAEELTGVQQVVDALRANTHEFMNKLHVILGLIQMKAYDEAKAYIINVRERDGQTVGPIMDIFEDSTLAGLILGKLNRARELGIAMSIAKGSCLESRHENITTQALIGIIGNLVENAFDAVIKRANISKSVNLSVVERSDGIVIAVSDNGIGLTEDEKPNIFERGYTTKKDSKGVGLSIVKNAVEAYGGTIEIRNNQGDGVTVTVHLPKGGS